MSQPPEPQGLGTSPSGRHLLGPHVVGTRVVVRRVLPGQHGPSGGPALTDVLGECLSWGEGPDGVVVLRPARGPDVRIAVADIVSGKPVPPRASVRSRVPAAQAQRHGFALFPDLVTTPLGAWVLRDSTLSGARRANSVLAFGPSGVDDDLEQVCAHYDRPVAAVLLDSPEHRRLAGLGWVPQSTDGPTLFLVAGLAQVARALRSAAHEGAVLEEQVPGAWARVRLGDEAHGYAGFDRDWVGLGGLEVAPSARRRGLGRAVVAALVEWGAELGATTVFLQVLEENRAARALYDALGFREHHRYCYLTPGLPPGLPPGLAPGAPAR